MNKATLTITRNAADRLVWTLYDNATLPGPQALQDAPSYMLHVAHDLSGDPPRYTAWSLDRGSRNDICLVTPDDWAILLEHTMEDEDCTPQGATLALRVRQVVKMTPHEERVFAHLRATWEAFAFTFNPAVL